MFNIEHNHFCRGHLTIAVHHPLVLLLRAEDTEECKVGGEGSQAAVVGVEGTDAAAVEGEPRLRRHSCAFCLEVLDSMSCVTNTSAMTIPQFDA